MFSGRSNSEVLAMMKISLQNDCEFMRWLPVRVLFRTLLMKLISLLQASHVKCADNIAQKLASSNSPALKDGQAMKSSMLTDPAMEPWKAYAANPAVKFLLAVFVT